MARFHYDAASSKVNCSNCDRNFSRFLEYQIASSDTRPRYSPNLLIFRLDLDHEPSWHAEVDARMTGEPLGQFFASTVTSPSGEASATGSLATSPSTVVERLHAGHREVAQWESRLPRLPTSNQIVNRAYVGVVRDLASLRLQKIGHEWYPAAGVPWYNCIFGRDALHTALQCLPLGCSFPRAVLTRLAELQGTRVNRWNDEEPGKIGHEYRVGQLSLTGKIPFNPFYETVDASLLYVILLTETHRFTGDHRLLEQFRGPMEGCLRWAADYGDIDGDGFIEYWMRTPHGYQNLSWKDAGDAVVYPDGTIVPDPIAIVEVQGYYYRALCDASEIYRVLVQTAKVDAAQEHATRLFTAINQTY